MPIKRFLVGLLLGALAWAPASGAPSRAQWTGNGIPIATTADVESSPMIVPDGAGGAVIAWVRFSPDSGGIYAVGLDPDGNVKPGWTPGGHVVHGGTDPDMVADGAGGAFIASQGFGGIAIQHFGPSTPVGGPMMRDPAHGSLVADPRTIEPAGALQAQHRGFVLPVLALDGRGGMFVSFTDEQRSYDHALIRHYKIGEPFVQVRLETIPGCAQFGCQQGYTPTVCPDGAGGVFVAWSARRGARVLRLTDSLTIVPGWPDSAAAVSTLQATAHYVGICPDGAGGAFVAWQGTSSGPSEFRVQRVTAAGSLAAGWPGEGLVLSPYPTLPGLYRTHYGSFCAIVPDGQGGALLSWTDQRADTGDVYVSRVSPDGTIAPGWPRYGVGAGIAPGVQMWPVVVDDGSGGAVVAWQDERDAPDLAIYTNHVTSGGAIVPPGTAEGVLVSSGAGDRLIPRLARDGAGGAFIAWADFRAGNGDVYAARVRANAVVGTRSHLVRAEADRERVRLEWRVAPEVDGPLRLERRTADSSFALLASLSPDGLKRVMYDDREIEPGGRYAYRLGIPDSAAIAFSDEVWVTVPEPPPPVLEGIHPNPASGEFALGFALAGSGEAWLEIVDLAGRTRVRREVGSLGPGSHQVTIGSDHGLAPGIYFVRLARAGQARTWRLSVIR